MRSSLHCTLRQRLNKTATAAAMEAMTLMTTRIVLHWHNSTQVQHWLYGQATLPPCSYEPALQRHAVTLLQLQQPTRRQPALRHKPRQRLQQRHWHRGNKV